MAGENLAALERLYDGWARGDMTAATPLLDELFVYVPQDTDLDRGPHYGVEASNRYMRRFLEGWDEWRIEATGYREVGDTVIADVHRTGKGKSGVTVDDRAYHVWTFRGGTAIRLDVLTSEADALATVGRAT
jgi:ketosteroid isomerase-like protein